MSCLSSTWSGVLDRHDDGGGERVGGLGVGWCGEGYVRMKLLRRRDYGDLRDSGLLDGGGV